MRREPELVRLMISVNASGISQGTLFDWLILRVAQFLKRRIGVLRHSRYTVAHAARPFGLNKQK